MKSTLDKKPSAKKEVDARKILNYLHMMNAEKKIIETSDGKISLQNKSV